MMVLDFRGETNIITLIGKLSKPFCQSWDNKSFHTLRSCLDVTNGDIHVPFLVSNVEESGHYDCWRS